MGTYNCDCLDHAYQRIAFVAAEFHVGPIDGGDDAAATIDAGSLVGNDGHPAGEVAAQVSVNAASSMRRAVRAQLL
jgi:hypothetical protein